MALPGLSSPSHLHSVGSRDNEAYTVRSDSESEKKTLAKHGKTEKGRRDDTTCLIEELGQHLPRHFLANLLAALENNIEEIYLKNLKSVSNNRKPAKNSILEQGNLYILALQEKIGKYHDILRRLAEIHPDVCTNLCAGEFPPSKMSKPGGESNDNWDQSIISLAVDIAVLRAENGRPISPGPDEQFRLVKSTYQPRRKRTNGIYQ